MKKIALFVAALALMTAMQAQVIVGLQGGYFQQNSTASFNDDYAKASHWLGGVRVGYEVIPNLEIYVGGSLLGENTAALTAIDSINFMGQPNVKITDHKFTTARSGWMVSPEVQYTFLKYGNMSFAISLGANIRSLGYTTHTESFYTVSWPNPNEYQEPDPYEEQVKDFSIDVSLRPSLSYEFSRHLSAELLLDFLSVGYVDAKRTDDATGDSWKTTTLYAGINTLDNAFDWEAPVFHLAFNWKF